jgi:hypothetical protein
MVKRCVLFEVWTEFLNVIKKSFGFLNKLQIFQNKVLGIITKLPK